MVMRVKMARPQHCAGNFGPFDTPIERPGPRALLGGI